MTACVSMLLKLRTPLTYFQTCFLPGRANDLSAPWLFNYLYNHKKLAQKMLIQVQFLNFFLHREVLEIHNKYHLV